MTTDLDTGTYAVAEYSSSDPERPPPDVLDVPGDFEGAVIGLRAWGRNELAPLGESSADAGTMLSAAELLYEGGLWRVRDRSGAAGLRLDGAPIPEVVLSEGAELTLGGTTFIAESRRSLALRALCARLIGWRDDRRSDVDRAVRAIRSASRRRAPLFVRGEGDLVLIGHAIHRHTLGPDAPFLVVDPRRNDHRATVRSPASRADVQAALREAAGGSLCVREARLPDGLDAILRALGDPASHVQLVVCAKPGRRELRLAGAALVELPPLSSRWSELRRIITEYALEATAALQAPAVSFTEHDVDWVARMSAQSLPDIEKATMRIVAVRTSRNQREAADVLGMAPVSLARWLARRTADPRTGERVPPPAFRAKRRIANGAAAA